MLQLNIMHNESNPRKYCHSFIEMYLLTKIHDVGGQEHVTAVRYIMHNEINPRKYCHSFRANVPIAKDT
jgi:hypothetical protein